MTQPISQNTYVRYDGVVMRERSPHEFVASTQVPDVRGVPVGDHSPGGNLGWITCCKPRSNGVDCGPAVPLLNDGPPSKLRPAASLWQYHLDAAAREANALHLRSLYLAHVAGHNTRRSFRICEGKRKRSPAYICEVVERLRLLPSNPLPLVRLVKPKILAVPRAANDNGISWPLGRLLASKTIGTEEQRDRWLAAAEWYEGAWMSGVASIQLRGTMLCQDDLMKARPDALTGDAGSGLVLEQRYSKKDGKRKGIRQLRGKVHPDTIRSEYRRPSDNDALIVAKIDAAPLLHKVNKALGSLRQSIERAIPQALTMGAIGQRLGYSGKYAEQKGKEAVLAGLNIIADFIESQDAGKMAENILLAA